MLVLTPQKEGDSSDPRMPLNEAEGEPQSGGHTHNHPANVNVNVPLPFVVLVQSPRHSILDTTVSAWASSSESFSPWVQYGESDLNGHSNVGVETSHPPNYAASTTNKTLSATLCVEMHGESGNIDPQMLEIDWVSCMSPCSFVLG
ncbi:uncharacterized protein N7482_005438 [Penicillium canariense]|uniref:Uncharacterized protein n=1 Tax=Penicillium canariense TaxID=189055 RepID=A0A9W9I6L4_9EURO|nr:uncharacterized protein N7482_005438 [Penicillium canariense]KAJ5166657.1 hypothetical protein N7482_005438 [Penicillium canariense]